MIVGSGFNAGWWVRLALLVFAFAALDGRHCLAGEGAEKLLDQVQKLEGKQAHKVMTRAVVLLEEETRNLTPGDRERLAKKWALLLPRAVRVPNDLRAILGDKATWSIARQVSYRRYRELWLVEHPLRICAVFEAVPGEEARLLTVRTLPAENP